MSRVMHKLSARKVDTVLAAGWHSDGGGLYLRIGKDGSKRWIFAWERNKKRREMGLGAAADVSLAAARDGAAEARAQLMAGLDPIDERRANQIALIAAELPGASTRNGEDAGSVGPPTFGVFADRYIDAHADGWKSAKHHKQWRATIRSHRLHCREWRCSWCYAA